MKRTGMNATPTARKRMTPELIAERARLHAKESLRGVLDVIRKQAMAMTPVEYELIFEEALTSAFTVGHAAGVCDQYSDPSLATRSTP